MGDPLEIKERYIYMTTCLINGKKYIGQRTRQRRNENGYMGSGHVLKRAFKKYGKQNFKKEIIVEGNFNLNLLNDLEKHYIRLYNADQSDMFYNIAKGGNIGSYGFKCIKYRDIYQYNCKGEILNTFPDAMTASKKLGISYDSVICSLRKGSLSFDSNSYFTTDVNTIQQRPAIKREVYCKDIISNEILHFESLTKCSDYFKASGSSGISNTLNSKNIFRNRYILSETEVFPEVNWKITNGRVHKSRSKKKI